MTKYEIGCSDETEMECLMKLYQSSKKDCVIVLPFDKLIWCYECGQDLSDMYESIEDRGDKKVAVFVKFVEEVQQKLHQNLERLKKQTNTKLMEQVRPGKYKEVTSSKTVKKEEIILPSAIYGIENIGNTCFFNSVMQCLNANRKLVNYYMHEAAVFDKLSSDARSRLLLTKSKHII